MIPATVNVPALLADLKAAGWKDYQVEDLLGLGAGHLSAIRRKKISNCRYETVAAIFNFHAQNVSRETNEQNQQQPVASSG